MFGYTQMIQMDRDILTTIAVVVCLVSTIYIFRELNKAKEEVDQLKSVSARLMQITATRPPPPPPPPRVKKLEVTEEDEQPVEENADEN